MTKALSGRRQRLYQKKVKEYAKFLKHDFDFDYAYILRLLAYKLSRTRKSIEKGCLANSKVVCAQIAKVEKLLKRVDEHEYDEEAVASFHKKHGKPKIVTTPIPGGEASTLEFIYRNGKPATKAMNKEKMRLYEVAHQRRVADLKAAFDIMLEHIWSWWD